MKCSHCCDTGSLDKNLDSYLDCPFCDVAEERAKFNRWAATIRERGAAAMWTAFNHGKAAAAGATN